MKAIVIDDTRSMRSVLRHILEEMNFDVVEAGNGQEALDLLSEHGQMDIALVDWNMPVMDGITFIQTINRDDRYAGMKLMMVTTESGYDKLKIAREHGVTHYITKPFNPDAIRDAIDVMWL